MRFGSIGSGSRGNGTLVAHEDTYLLVDCGFGYQDTVKRLDRMGVTPEMLSAILVTHEHSDHWSGVSTLAKRHRLPVYASRGTWIEVGRDPSLVAREINGCWSVGSIDIAPVVVPHDARQPVQFVFDSGRERLGVLSDLGSVSRAVLDALVELDALSVEFNHDLERLWAGAYPAFLKARVAGDYGHLNNDQAEALVAAVKSERLSTVVACHLSEQNNEVSQVAHQLDRALGSHRAERWVASQSEGTDWMEVKSR